MPKAIKVCCTAYAPHHFQITSVDCVPVSFINAIQCLYKRDEIPPEVVRTIWSYSLNSYDAKGHINGTSMAGIELIVDWLSEYRLFDFNLETELLYDHLVTQKALEECLTDGGVVIVEIQISRFYHYILVLGYDAERFYFFDPYERVRNVRGVQDNVARLKSDGYTPNLSVNKEWMFSWSKNKKYCLGSKSARVAILLYRKD